MTRTVIPNCTETKPEPAAYIASYHYKVVPGNTQPVGSEPGLVQLAAAAAVVSSTSTASVGKQLELVVLVQSAGAVGKQALALVQAAAVGQRELEHGHSAPSTGLYAGLAAPPELVAALIIELVSLHPTISSYLTH
jgi:hypothetical protein